MGSLAAHASRGFEMASRLLKMAFWRQLWTNLSPSWLQVASRWAQVGVKLAQVGPKLAPSWLRLGPKSAPGGSPEGYWKGPGRVLEPRGASGGLRGAKMIPKSLQNDLKVMPKRFKFDPKSITIMTSKSFQKQLPCLATLS